MATQEGEDTSNLMLDRSLPQPSLITPHPTLPTVDNPPPAGAAAPPRAVAVDPPLAGTSLSAMAPATPWRGSRWGPQPHVYGGRPYAYDQEDPWDTQDPWSQEAASLRAAGHSPNRGFGLQYLDNWLAQRRGDLLPGRPGGHDNLK